MANNGSAEPKPGSPRNQAQPADRPLLQQAKALGEPNQPHLRIVYSADRMRESSSYMQTQQPRRPPSDGASGMLDRTVQAQIGRMLRDIFADVAAEPVPHRFVKLLAALDAKEGRR
jgi:Anti-sigma factor NepR